LQVGSVLLLCCQHGLHTLSDGIQLLRHITLIQRLPELILHSCIITKQGLRPSCWLRLL
jgi:hypothetical protein